MISVYNINFKKLYRLSVFQLEKKLYSVSKKYEKGKISEYLCLTRGLWTGQHHDSISCTVLSKFSVFIFFFLQKDKKSAICVYRKIHQN